MDVSSDFKRLDKAIKETEPIIKKYMQYIGKLEEDLKGKSTILLDDAGYNKLLKFYKDIRTVVDKQEREVDNCVSGVDIVRAGASVGTPTMGVGGASGLGKRKNGKDATVSPLQKLKRPKKGEWVIAPGSAVATRQAKQQWIFATVISFNAKTNRYEVEDPEEEDEAAKRFVVGAKDIIPLPPDPNKVKEGHDPSLYSQTGSYLSEPFSDGTKVLAMFPATTAFYPAIVSGHQRGAKAHKNLVASYMLQFEDDHEDGFTPSRKVHAQFVVPYQK